MLNKQVAAELGASEAGVKMYRSQVMKKMHAKSLPELVRIVDKLRPLELLSSVGRIESPSHRK